MTDGDGDYTFSSAEFLRYPAFVTSSRLMFSVHGAGTTDCRAGLFYCFQPGKMSGAHALF